ncbi:MAG: nicotinate-nucleotide adenylyltransferase [Methylophaga sp.]|nr:nicotinate-nucleotide adenylyltransferase [Methylophaga sp.]
MAESIGILGGTFDPVHFGHLRPALDVADQLGLDRIHLIPSARPPHRGEPQATPEQRLTMLQLAVKNNPQFVVDDRELHREGNSYTIDTLLSLRQEFPNSPLYLMVGTDAFSYIQTWHRWQELLDLAHIVVMQRPDETLTMSDEMTSWYRQHLAINGAPTQLAGKIWRVNVTQLAISATEIRTKIAQGSNPQYLLPDAVIQLISMLGLYK